jgi:NADPH-dependent 2,4-dienoyl-CoA reductase/sulfur reductase-like enzyme
MTVREHRALVIVGGGPAGLAAASEAVAAGLPTCLVEQGTALHGPHRLRAPVEAGVEVRLATAAWGIWGHEVSICPPSGPASLLVAEQVILASGAYERPVAFPGWTLPGVMSAEGAVRLLEQGVAPGRRVLVAGFGGWVAKTADRLRALGQEIVEVIDASARAGRMVVRAEGAGRLERVFIARVDADWCPRAGTERALEVDALVLAFGWLPENQLARLAGCEYRGSAYLDPRVVHDGWQRSSVPGILVAGDAGGIVGAEAAIEQGRLAGLAAAVDAGCLSQAEAARRGRSIQRRLRSLEAAAAERDPRPGAGLYALADDETVICRCEDVTAGQVAARLFEGSFEPGPPIAESRAGMGRCQGRNCASLIAAAISRHSGQPIDRIPPITPRPPAVLVPLGALEERPAAFVAD